MKYDFEERKENAMQVLNNDLEAAKLIVDEKSKTAIDKVILGVDRTLILPSSGYMNSVYVFLIRVQESPISYYLYYSFGSLRFY